MSIFQDIYNSEASLTKKALLRFAKTMFEILWSSIMNSTVICVFLHDGCVNEIYMQIENVSKWNWKHLACGICKCANRCGKMHYSDFCSPHYEIKQRSNALQVWYDTNQCKSLLTPFPTSTHYVYWYIQIKSSLMFICKDAGTYLLALTGSQWPGNDL